MTDFVRFNEYCDWEGENWVFWLQVDGNEDALRQLDTMIQEDYAVDTPYDYPYEMDFSDPIAENAVDILVKYSDVGYIPDHNKVVGKLVIPESFCIDDLYKGGVKEIFK